MQSTATSPPLKLDALALLYQNVLTGIVRIQAGRQQLADLETFRRRMKSALQEVEREANLAGYGAAVIRDAEFAVVALLDETVLSSKGTAAEEWRKQPLNVELFGQTRAGDIFFDKLAEIERTRDSSEVGDLLEVYLLCLLLGFEGRLAPPLRGEAYRLMERLRLRIESIRRLDYRLSAPIEVQAVAQAIERRHRPVDWRWWIVGATVAAILLFLIYKLNLSLRLDDLQSRVLGHGELLV